MTGREILNEMIKDCLKEDDKKSRKLQLEVVRSMSYTFIDGVGEKEDNEREDKVREITALIEAI